LSGTESTSKSLTVLDCAALVTGAAIASVHVRPLILSHGLAPTSPIVMGAFLLIAATSAGPFVLAAIRYQRIPLSRFKIGEILWGILGLPWLASAFLRPSVGSARRHPGTAVDAYTLTLAIGLVASSLIALGVVWTTWVAVAPEAADRAASPPWTNRVGFLLAVTWPLQCASGFLILG
jgi:hypothetical protein